MVAHQAINIEPLLVACSKDKAGYYAFPLGSPRFFIPTGKLWQSKPLVFFLPFHKIILLIAKSILARTRGIATTYYCTSKLLEDVKNLAGFPTALAVISAGTPGPFNKQTILLVNDNGRPLALAKAGFNSETAQLLANEEHWLETLGGQSNLREMVPAFITSAKMPRAYILVQSISTASCANSKISKLHLHFLSALQKSAEPNLGYEESQMAASLKQRFHFLRKKMDPSSTRRSEFALNILHKRLAGVNLPMVVAHRDFAPWNIRRGKNSLYVFDWEYASQGYIPLYDLFHFMLMPTAIHKTLSTKDATRALQHTIDLCTTNSDWHHKTQAPDAQLLAYFLDIFLFYLESIGGLQTDHKVITNYGAMIDLFFDWSSNTRILD